MSKRKRVRYRMENRNTDATYFMEVVADGTKVTWMRGLERGGRIEIQERGGERGPTADDTARIATKLVEQRGRHYKDKSRHEEDAPAETSGPTAAAVNPALEAEVLAARDNPGPASVYADWLQTQGDPRGELAALWLSGRDDAAREWLARNLSLILGDLDVKLDSEVYDLVWRHGLLAGVSLKRADIDSNTVLSELTRDFLALPTARLISDLRFGLAGYESDNDWSETLATIASAPQAGQIRSLRFDDYESEDCEISWTAFGDFAPHWSRLRALEVLAIRAGEGGSLGTLELPNLRTFIRISGGLGRSEIDEILAARWPHLEHLEVWFGSDNYGAAGGVADAMAMLEHAPPSLTRLGICNSEFVHELIEPLAKSRRLQQLTELDLSRGVLMDSDVDRLLSHADAFRHLVRLDLSANQLVERAAEVARALPNATIAKQRNYDDDRYVALGE